VSRQAEAAPASAPKVSFSLEGKVAVVTGASRGIGRSIALALADAGAAVVPVARTVSALEEVAAEVEGAGGRALPVEMDVTVPESVERGFAAAEDAFGRIDVVVNNAGVPYHGPSEEMSFEDWNHTLAVNLSSAFLVCRAAAPHLFAAGGGSIVNIGSIDSLAGMHSMAAYCAAKAGVLGLTKALAAEWATRGVRVNCVCPGAVATEMTERVRQSPDSGFYRHLMGHTPLGRFAEPEEMVGAVVFLASSAASYVTGAVLSVDGGFSAV
jgi:3-oxoacyl-[acyl-carrier protein] reductase